VHGLWLSGLESFTLRHHLLQAHDYNWHNFSYASVGDRAADVATALNQFVTGLGAERAHLIGHSMGGLVIHRALLQKPPWPPGRVVFMGTPSHSSQAAAHVAGWPVGSMMLGHAVEELLNTQPRQWDVDRELGIIAGNSGKSIGSLLTDFREPSDGTVSVAETQLPGATAHLTLPVGHTSMLFSAEVARQAGYFLEHGCFASVAE
jgi:pimeloyl-ACP methyl ester carboxylesterase